MTKLIAGSIRHRRGVILLFLLLAGASSVQLTGLRVDNSVERWLGDDKRTLASYERFLERFGQDEFLIIGLVAKDPLSPESLDSIDTLTSEVEALDGVADVLSLSKLARAVPGVSWPLSEEHRSDLRSFVAKSEVGSGMLMSRDGEGTALFITIDARDNERFRLVETLERVAVDARDMEGVEFAHLGGAPAIANALDRMSREGLKRFMPWVFVVSILLIWWLVGNSWLVVACVLPAISSVLITFAVFVLLGLELDLVTSIIAPLVFILSLSGAIHVVSHYRRLLRERGGGEPTLIDAVSRISRPLLYINLTTTLGLLALLVSNIHQIRTLGLMSAMGVGIGHATALFFGGALLAQFRSRIERAPKLRSPWGQGLANFCILNHQKRSTLLLLATIVVLCSGLALAPSLKVNSRWLEHFPEDHSTRVATEYFASQYAGLTPLEICFHLPEGSKATDPKTLESIAEVESAVRQEAWIGKSFSLAGVYRDVIKLVGDDQSEFAKRITWSLFVENGPVWLRKMVDAYLKDDVARIRVLSPELSSTKLVESFRTLDQRLSTIMPADSYEITGMVRLVLAMQDQLMSSQIRSFSVAFVLIMVVFLVVFRAVRVAMVAMLPNLLPLAAAVILLVVWGEPLNVATIMIASISMGIAVDSSIHFCSAYREARREGLGPDDASAMATRHTAPAIATAGLVIALGFFSLAFADFWMIAIFGILVSFVMIVALAASLLVVPVLLPRVDQSQETSPALRAETSAC